MTELEQFRNQMKQALAEKIEECYDETDFFTKGQRDGLLWALEYLDGEHRETFVKK